MTARTRRQREVLDYIVTFIERHGYEPSYQQIARHFRISAKSAIAKHIAALEAQGLLARRQENGKFSLSVQPERDLSDAVCAIPLLTNLVDDFFTEDAETIAVPRFLLGAIEPARVFAFRVMSDSMIDEHICAGDIALIERGVFASDGETVVALIHGKHPTLERFYNHGATIELRPANARLNPLVLPAGEITVCGTFRGLLRSLAV